MANETTVTKVDIQIGQKLLKYTTLTAESKQDSPAEAANIRVLNGSGLLGAGEDRATGREKLGVKAPGALRKKKSKVRWGSKVNQATYRRLQYATRNPDLPRLYSVHNPRVILIP